MQNEDIQKELLKETLELDKALAIAINIEMGTLNQLKMNANKNELNSTVNQVQWMRIANATPFSTMNTTARKKPTTCHFCGMNWTPEHRIRCPARGKKCNNCGIDNHFAKVCRKPKKNLLRTQNPGPGLIMSRKTTKLKTLIKFRLILILNWNQIIHRMKIIAWLQYLRRNSQLQWRHSISS